MNSVVCHDGHEKNEGTICKTFFDQEVESFVMEQLWCDYYYFFYDVSLYGIVFRYVTEGEKKVIIDGLVTAWME